MRQKKPKIPPISAERKALFDAAGIDEYRADVLHRSLYEHPLAEVQKRAAEIGVPWVDLELTGNQIIKRYIESQREHRQSMARMALARQKWWCVFQETFRKNLSDYWESNLTGLDICRLDEEVIKPPDGTSTKDYLLAKHGPVAVQMIEELIHGVPENKPA